MAYGARLESVCTFIRTEGSNPSLSANFKFQGIQCYPETLFKQCFNAITKTENRLNKQRSDGLNNFLINQNPIMPVTFCGDQLGFWPCC